MTSPPRDIHFELVQAAKSFAGIQALAPTSLEIRAGQTTVLIGPSGCGKSTLLRLLVGLLAPDQGEIRFDGRPLAGDYVQEARRRMGFVLQDGGLFPHLTAFQNVALLARYLGWEPLRVDQRVSELAELTRFPATALTRFPSQLSGGQRQRVGIMRALMLDPDVVLLDEPMGALDPLVRFELQEDLRGIFQELGKTTVLVTHDMGEAGFFGDSIVLLGAGRVMQQGHLADLLERPSDPFVTRFLSAQRWPSPA